MPWSSFSECWAWSQLFHSLLSLSSRAFLVSLHFLRVVSSAYLRWLIFLPAILIPACASSGPAFRMLYAACRLHKQGDNIQPWGTPFPIWNHSVVPCPVLTVACTQISQEAGKVVWYSHLFKNFPQFVVIHTVKVFDVVNKAKVDVFLELSCFFKYPRMLAIWSLVPLPFLNPGWTSEIPWFTYHCSLAWRILSITLLACEISAIVQ